MSKFTSIEELFNTAEQSVGPPTEGGDGNQELRVFQPDRGIDVTYNNPNFTGQSDTSTSTQILEERDNRQTLGTVTLNNRDYWENSNFDESIFQSYVKGKIETTLNTRPIIDDNEEEIVFNESFDASPTYRYSVDALPFVTDPNKLEFFLFKLELVGIKSSSVSLKTVPTLNSKYLLILFSFSFL